MRNRGFSLVEFMIAITVSTIILAALTATFVSNSRARLEIDRANQQIENGRYAVTTLADDLQLAGFHSTYYILNDTDAAVGVPAQKAAPCVTAANALIPGLRLHVLGYDNSSLLNHDGTPATCPDAGGNDLLADYKAGTDVLVVRRAATCTRGSANCPDQNGAPYFQASMCGDELNTIASPSAHFRLSATIANLDRRDRNCGGVAPMRQWMVHVYFITNNDAAGDGIPTLKRAELTGEGGVTFYKALSLANGIENMQIEYGIDKTGDGRPDAITASPDTREYDAAGVQTNTHATCAANPDCVQNWADVVSVKVSLLARNPGKTQGHTDTKRYSLGLTAGGAIQCATGTADGNGDCPAFNDAYKRHVYQSAVRLNNAAGRRE